MKSFSDIRKDIDVDLRIDYTKLTEESVRTPMLYSKYLNLFHSTRMKYVRQKADHDKMASIKYYYYRDDHDILPKNAAEIKILMDGDDDVISSRNKVEYLREQMEYYEKVLKQVEYRGYSIKNIIEWERFQHGG